MIEYDRRENFMFIRLMPYFISSISNEYPRPFDYIVYLDLSIHSVSIEKETSGNGATNKNGRAMVSMTVHLSLV